MLELDENNYKHYPESFFASQPLIKIIQTPNSLLNKLAINLRELNIKDSDELVRLIKLSNELHETLTIINDCIDCNKFLKNKENNFLIDELTAGSLNNSEIYRKEEIVNKMIDKINNVLCNSCQEKKSCGNEKIIRLLCQYKENNNSKTIKWIPFNELKDIKYLSKGGFSVVHKATWINYQDVIFEKFEEKTVVLKQLNNSKNYILDIFNEVNLFF